VKSLELSDLQLKSCTKWVANGQALLPIPHVIPFYYYAQTGQMYSDVELATPSEGPFVCKVISSTGTVPGTIVQIQWPDGRYLSNPGIDFFSFVGTGRRGRLVYPHKILPRTSKIRLNLDNTNGANANMEIFFEGLLLMPMVKS